RHPGLRGGSRCRRPLLFYGPEQRDSDSPPVAAPPLPLGWFEKHNPVHGKLWEEDERDDVRRVVEAVASRQNTEEELLMVALLEEDKKVEVDVYNGEVDGEGRPHGQGDMTWAQGDTYSGRWVHGAMSGRGTLVSKSAGETYEGE
ncbi:unnamed protein product, partial [Discosporangium mesarthrocarpum]